MRDRIWTPDQTDAIEATDGTLIVSAAAGSGKTAVLVERVIRRLTDADKPCDADRLLIVTFTRAATAEMRSRLSAGINSRLRENPNDEHLQKQQMLLPSAHIYTIDSFCTGLVRENFDVLGISPDFTTLDENESKIMQKAAVETVMEKLYEQNSPEFKSLVELLFVGRDDTSLEENIINLYTYSRAYPAPRTWLKNAVTEYDSTKPLHALRIGTVIRDNALQYVTYIQEMVTASISDFDKNDELAACKAYSILKTEASICETILNLIEEYKFDEAVAYISDVTFDRWGVPKGYTEHTDVVRAKSAHGLCKEAFEKGGIGLRKILCSFEHETREDMAMLEPVAKKLIEATFMFEEEFMKLKEEKNALDFSDIELLALKLLVEDPSSDTLARTALAKDLSLQFDEILIDEYQDTNRAQDMIFRAVSRDEQNLFMVGDVKQSIYGFRQAMPEIFLEKKNAFETYDRDKNNYPSTIVLGKNFRSRKGITEYINFVFSQLMSPACGDIEYSDCEKLSYGAGYPDTETPEVELHIINAEKEEDILENEGKLIAEYILNEIEKVRADCGEDVSFGDFAILMQSLKNRAPVIEKVLNQYGIPVCTDVGGGFLSTADIQIMVSLLHTIDNPLSDIPLLSVLMSPLFAFSEDEIAELRINERRDSLYSAVLKAEAKGNEKCGHFLKALRKYRRLSVSLTVGELVRKIYEETAFPYIAGAMPGGKQRTANLLLLQKYADDFDKTGAGLSGFVRYLDRLAEHKIDPGAASLISANTDAVKIMSIHKSKGLEFKYCILADCAKSFNKTDLNKNLILHPTLGIGIKGRNLNTGNTYPTLMHTAVKLETEKRLISETLRVLYVALTRAREKLIMVGTVPGKLDTAITKKAGCLSRTSPVHPYTVLKSTSFLDWILLSTLRHPSAKPLRDETSLLCELISEDAKIVCQIHQTSANEEKTVDEAAKNYAYDEALCREITERMSYKYPYAPLADIPTKRSASGIDKAGFNPDFFASVRPEFASKLSLTPAQRGTCLHKFMQYADFDRVTLNFEDELSRLVADGFLSETEASAVSKEKVLTFIHSDFAKRIFASPKVMREKKFSVLVPAGTFNDELDDFLKDEDVLIQGIADCVFEENGTLIVVDYKTDRTTDESELMSRHKPQLLTYVHALEKCTGYPISAAYIYSFSLGKEIRVI